MRTKTVVSATAFTNLFDQVVPEGLVGATLRRSGFRFRCPPLVTHEELIKSLVFHGMAGSGTLAQHVNELTGKRITDGALSQRRALLPPELFQELMGAALKPKADPLKHPAAFYHGLRLCGVDGTLFFQ
jgi:hypothetical protein